MRRGSLPGALQLRLDLLLFLGFLGNRLAQPHGLKGLAALDRLGYEHAGADQQPFTVRRVLEIPLGTELHRLKLQIRALQLRVLLHGFLRRDLSIAKGSRRALTARKKFRKRSIDHVLSGGV